MKKLFYLKKFAIKKYTLTSCRKRPSKLSPDLFDQRGFSIVESLILLALIAILAVIAVPNINSMTGKYRLSGATRIVWGDLQNAKMTAIKTNQSVAVSFDTATQYSFPRWDGTNFIRDLSKEYPSVTVTKSGGGNITFLSNGMTLNNQNATVNVQGTAGNKTIALTWTGRILVN
jgi:Tfp pilus assembly protein FimT